MIALQASQHHIKRKLTVLLSLMLIVMCACQDQKETKLSNVNENELSDSMRNFTSIDSLDYNEENCFQAKLLEVNRIDSAKTNTVYYYYNILVAPRTLAVKQIRSITFKPETELLTYYDENKQGSLSGLTEWNYIFKEVEYPYIEEVQDYTAYQYDFVFSNLNNEIQKKENISDDELNEFMKHITIEIIYNDILKETLHLTANEVLCFKNVEDIPKNLKPLHNGDSIVTGMQPFDEK